MSVCAVKCLGNMIKGKNSSNIIADFQSFANRIYCTCMCIRISREPSGTSRHFLYCTVCNMQWVFFRNEKVFFHPLIHIL